MNVTMGDVVGVAWRGFGGERDRMGHLAAVSKSDGGSLLLYGHPESREWKACPSAMWVGVLVTGKWSVHR